MKQLLYILGFTGLITIFLAVPQLVTDTTAITSYVANMLHSSNFHEVVPRRFYRSGSLSSSQLTKAINKYKIKTVINLSLNSNLIADEGKDENQIVSALGARYLHVPMRSTRPPSDRYLEMLIGTIRSVEAPVLVHCTSGTHRSGFIASLWLLEREYETFATTKQQLSPRYGYFYLERKLKEFTQGHATLDDLLWTYGQEGYPQGLYLSEWYPMYYGTSSCVRLNTDNAQACMAPQLEYPDNRLAFR